MHRNQILRWTQRELILLILSSVVPLLVAIAVLQILAPLGNPLSDTDISKLRDAIRSEQILTGALTYSTASLLHFFVCLTSLWLARRILRSVPNSQTFAWTGVLMAGGAALLILLLGLSGGRNIMAINLSYFTIEDLLHQTLAVAPLGKYLPFTPLGLWAYGPTLLGIFAVAMMSAAAAAQLSTVGTRESEDYEAREAKLCVVYSHIKQCAYVLSLVLVTSTISASTYFHLPLKGLSTKAEPLTSAHAHLESLASELSLFWGALYTLTLIAAVGIPLLLVQKQFRDFIESLKPPERAVAMRERLTKGGFLSDGRDQAKLFLSFVAPLASGPAISLVQGLLT